MLCEPFEKINNKDVQQTEEGKMTSAGALAENYQGSGLQE